MKFRGGNSSTYIEGFPDDGKELCAHWFGLIALHGKASTQALRNENTWLLYNLPCQKYEFEKKRDDVGKNLTTVVNSVK